MAENNISSKSGSQKTRHKNGLHHLRIPRKLKKIETDHNVLYVSSNTNIKMHLDVCHKLLSNKENEVIIYCMGAAIQRGILLALRLCEEYITYKISTNTLTTELLDDLEPTVDDAEYDVQKRFNSALRIRVFNFNPLDSVHH